jgi:UDP-glucuronate decarboxylase
LAERVLVTGGAGFLGSHLCEWLVRRGHDVLCVDNFYTGNKMNLLALRGNPDFELMRHDITFPLYVEVDQIFNLACPAAPIYYQFDPVQTTKTSVHGAINMLGLAKRLKAKILQASTSEVYGDPTVHPQPESYLGNVNPLGPRACYDEGKRCAETLFFDYHRQHGVPIRVARIFNTYGPRMQPSDGRVVSNFIVQALRGEPITVYGDGRQTRSFCFVDDLIDGLLRLMAADDDVTGPINLGNPHEVQVLELAERIVGMTGSKSRIEFEPMPADDPRQRQPDISAARRLLDWEPKVSIKEGMGRTIAHFPERLREASKCGSAGKRSARGRRRPAAPDPLPRRRGSGAPDESGPAREPVAIDDTAGRPAVSGRRALHSGPAGRRQARRRARRRA